MVSSIDFYNSIIKKKQCDNYGFPYLNIGFGIVNHNNLEKEWNEFIAQVNESDLNYLLENISGIESKILESEVRETIKQGPNRVQVNKKIATRNSDEKHKFEFILKNHNNQYLLEHLQFTSHPKPVSVYYMKLEDEKQKTTQQEVITKFEYMNNIFKINFNIQNFNNNLEQEALEKNNANTTTTTIETPITDDPLITFVYDVVGYMHKKNLKLDKENSEIYKKIPDSEYTYLKHCTFDVFLEKYLEKNLNLFKEKKKIDYLRKLKTDPYLKLYLPRIKRDKLVEFNNGIYEIETNTFYKKSDNKFKKNKTCCMNYYSIDFPPPKPKHFYEILNNSFNEQDNLEKFLYYYGKLWHKKQRRDKTMFLYGPTQCGKSTLVQPFYEIYGEDFIGFLTSKQEFSKKFLRGDKKVFILDEFHKRQLKREDLLRLFEGGQGLVADEKFEKQTKVKCDVPIIVISNNPIEYNINRSPDPDRDMNQSFNPNNAIKSRIIQFNFKTLKKVSSTVIDQVIKQESPAVLFYSNAFYLNFTNNVENKLSFNKVGFSDNEITEIQLFTNTNLEEEEEEEEENQYLDQEEEDEDSSSSSNTYMSVTSPDGKHSIQLQLEDEEEEDEKEKKTNKKKRKITDLIKSNNTIDPLDLPVPKKKRKLTKLSARSFIDHECEVVSNNYDEEEEEEEEEEEYDEYEDDFIDDN